MLRPHVLLIDDDPRFCLAMSKALRRRGFEVEVVHDSDDALEALNAASSDCVAVLDLKMPKRSGLEVLRETQRQRRAPVLMLTGHGAVPEAVEAMKAGAYTFLTKPIDAADLEPMILQAHRGRTRLSGVAEFIGESPVARQIRSITYRLTEVDAPVLLTGDTGTGKEVIARTLHLQSSRSESPFVAVNMASLSQRNFELELFGEEASRELERAQNTSLTSGFIHRRGLLTETMEGTLFLDEIDELSLEHQVKLLRLIEDRSYRPVNGGELRRFEGRIIASSHQSLERLVREGTFREDLFHRLNVYPIYLPPLTERGEDAALIFRYWLQRITGLQVVLDPSAHQALCAHSWRGNAREVVNLARRASVLCVPLSTQRTISKHVGPQAAQAEHATGVREGSKEIALEGSRDSDTPPEMLSVNDEQLAPLLNHQLFSHHPRAVSSSLSMLPERLDHQPVKDQPLDAVETERSHEEGEESSHLIGGDISLEDIERAHILKLVERHGNLSHVARILNVNRRTLQRKLKIWGD